MVVAWPSGFSPDAEKYARQYEVALPGSQETLALWGSQEIVSNWMRSGAIGIALENGDWYLVGSTRKKERAHMTAKRRVVYS